MDYKSEMAMNRTINFLNLGLNSFAETRQITSPTDTVRGEIKLSVQYHRGALTVMVSFLFQIQFNYLVIQ